MPATKLPDAGSGTSTVAATGAAAPGASTAPAADAAAPAGFDAILLLEELAASATALDTGSPELEAGDAADLDTKASDDKSDDDADELEGPLAFLAGLLAFAPTTHAAAPAVAGDGADAIDGDASGGGLAGHAASKAEHLLIATDADASAAAKAAGADAAQLFAAAADASATAHRADDAAQKADAANTANALRSLDAMAQSLRTPGAPEKAAIVTHARDPRWAEEFGARIALMVRGGESAAALSLTPVDLGPVDVSVTVRDSQATIHFGAAQADTRALIEASLPRLRELLAASGFNLTDASVSQGFARQPRGSAPRVAGNGAGEPEVEATRARAVRLSGLLDTYA